MMSGMDADGKGGEVCRLSQWEGGRAGISRHPDLHTRECWGGALARSACATQSPNHLPLNALGGPPKLVSTVNGQPRCKQHRKRDTFGTSRVLSRRMSRCVDRFGLTPSSSPAHLEQSHLQHQSHQTLFTTDLSIFRDSFSIPV